MHGKDPQEKRKVAHLSTSVLKKKVPVMKTIAIDTLSAFADSQYGSSNHKTV